MTICKKGFKPLILMCLLSLSLISCAKADVKSALEQYMWKKRVVLIFSPHKDDARLKTQIESLEDSWAGVDDRDIVKWIMVDQEFVKVDNKYMPHLTTPPLYDAFDVGRDDFTFILIGKDGYEKMRRNEVTQASDLFNLIDSMPMRQREVSK